MVPKSVILQLRRPRQEEHHKSEASLGYRDPITLNSASDIIMFEGDLSHRNQSQSPLIFSETKPHKKPHSHTLPESK